MGVSTKGAVLSHLPQLPHKMDRSRVAFFSQEELVIITEGCEEYRKNITANSNSAAAKKAREECWRKIGHRLNS